MKILTGILVISTLVILQKDGDGVIIGKNVIVNPGDIQETVDKIQDKNHLDTFQACEEKDSCFSQKVVEKPVLKHDCP